MDAKVARPRPMRETNSVATELRRNLSRMSHINWLIGQWESVTRLGSGGLRDPMTFYWLYIWKLERHNKE